MTAEEHKENVNETLEEVNRFVFVKEYENGYVNVVGERTDVKIIRNCLAAMFAYIQFLEEKISAFEKAHDDDPMGFQKFLEKK